MLVLLVGWLKIGLVGGGGIAQRQRRRGGVGGERFRSVDRYRGLKPGGTAATGSAPELVSAEEFFVRDLDEFGGPEDVLPAQLSLGHVGDPANQTGVA